MNASTIQLRLHNGQNHSSSLTFYSNGRAAKPALSRRLAEAKSGGNLDILPTKMTNGFSGRISKAIDSEKIECEKESRTHRRTSKTYVSCLQTSLSTDWTKSLSRESEENEYCKPVNDRCIADMDGSPKKKTPTVRETERKRKNGNDYRNVKSEGQKPETAKPRASDRKPVNSSPFNSKGRTKGKRSEEDVHVSVQPASGKQLTIISSVEDGKVSVTSYGDGSANVPKSCTSYVYIKSKFDANHYSKTKKSAVVVQKPPLCRSITISEASLSKAMSRQTDQMSSQSRRNTNLRQENSKSLPAINVQRKSKRSFTVSNDTTDGKLRTIHESTMEGNCD